MSFFLIANERRWYARYTVDGFPMNANLSADSPEDAENRLLTLNIGRTVAIQELRELCEND